MRNERRYVTVLLRLGILVIALLLDDLVDLVNCLLTGKALLSLKTKLLTALQKKTVSKNSCQYEMGNRCVSWRVL